MTAQEDNQFLLVAETGSVYHTGGDFTSLPPSPATVAGDFVLTDANDLISLTGVPSVVTGVFHLAYCAAISSCSTELHPPYPA